LKAAKKVHTLSAGSTVSIRVLSISPCPFGFGTKAEPQIKLSGFSMLASAQSSTITVRLNHKLIIQNRTQATTHTPHIMAQHAEILLQIRRERLCLDIFQNYTRRHDVSAVYAKTNKDSVVFATIKTQHKHAKKGQ
jgi:hypothetical protein